jgi:hypothetical protein
MARRKLTDEEKTAKLKAEQIERDYKEHIKKLEFCPEPTYFFNVGDSVTLGSLKDVVITEVLEGGKFYKLRYSVIHNNYGNPYREDGLERYAMWYDVRPLPVATESFIRNADISLNFYSTHLRDIFSKAYYFGLDSNPDYQREYVWDEADKVALIDSIFNNIDIGKFCFIHKDYGEKYLYEVLDGKQRVRAILDFYENRFAYKGKFFNDLCTRDQDWFENFSINVARVERASKKDVLKYFLMLNRSGKVMSKEQLEKVEEMYQAMKD